MKTKIERKKIDYEAYRRLNKYLEEEWNDWICGFVGVPGGYNRGENTVVLKPTELLFYRVTDTARAQLEGLIEGKILS